MALQTYALVTGASQGIGKAIATELASKGYNLVLVARSKDVLDKLAAELRNKFKVDAVVFASDLSKPNAHEAIYDWCISNDYAVSILINNAGYAVFGLFESVSLSKQLDMMQVNNTALVSLCHIFIPMLKKHSKSYILNISSTTAYQAVPGMSLYAASKVFVLAFSRGLQMELEKSGMHVCCLVPGPTDTNFLQRADMMSLKAMAAKVEMPAEAVAKIALKGMFAGAVEIIPGAINKVSYVFTKLLPKRLFEKIAAGIYLKKLS